MKLERHMLREIDRYSKDNLPSISDRKQQLYYQAEQRVASNGIINEKNGVPSIIINRCFVVRGLHDVRHITCIIFHVVSTLMSFIDLLGHNFMLSSYQVS